MAFETTSVFDCRRCGQCCEGKGGIVLSAKDIERVASFLDKSVEQIVEEYGEYSNGKLKVRSGENGACVFYKPGAGCAIHVARPDICRAWPFFKGNLLDESSFAMAREYCPGISLNVAFETFVQAGLEYLEQNQLISRDNDNGANALNIDNLKTCVN